MKRGISPTALLLTLFLLIPSLLQAGEIFRHLTLYTRDLGVVTELRSVELDKGTHDLFITGIVPAIVDGSVRVEVTKGAEIHLESVQFNTNLLDIDKYWDARVGEDLTIFHDDTISTGILKRVTSSNLFLDREGMLEIVARSQADKSLEIETIPAGLVTEPTLILRCSTTIDGKRQLKLTYMVDGLHWSGAHRVALAEGVATVSPGFAITNTTGERIEYGLLNLVGGDIHRAGDKRRVDRLNPKPGASGYDPTFKTGDLRFWKIDIPGTLTVGITSLHPRGELVGRDVERYYVYDATIFDDRASAKLAFSLPSALPGGIVRVFERDDGPAMFTGEDTIDDTPAGSTLELTLGQVFDLSAERIRTAEGAREEGETVQGVQVTLGNSGREMVTVRVLERLFGDWSITMTGGGDAVEYQRVDARTARFDVPVGAGLTETVSYEIRYAR
ncbi:hypothetical protein KQI63_12945 [bacterium]|nr:hypothetical protein [bacterium]